MRNIFYFSGRMAANIGWIMAGMGVAITGLSLYPSFEALDHDRWEAMKEYREYCEVCNHPHGMNRFKDADI